MSSASTTFTSGQSPTAAQVNGWAQGTLGYAQAVANQTGITTVVDVTGLTATVTVVANRRIRITGYCQGQSSVAGDGLTFRIMEGATQLQDCPMDVTTANRSITFHTQVVIQPSAGAHSYKMTFQRYAGTGTALVGASTSAPAFILVEDIGAV